MNEQIKELRVKIDGLAQLTKQLKGFKKHVLGPESQIWYPSQETANAYDSLLLAKAWLGKVLEELGEQTPYVNDGKRKTVEDIEPAANVSDLNDFVATKLPSDETVNLIKVEKWENKTHIEKVDWLRQEIQHVTHVVYQICVNSSKIRFHSEISYRHLCEAKFWLGFELQRIKKK